MAKRFTDTAKWKDSWYQDLPSKYKLFWIYILDECDNSGVWKPNIRLASFQIGEPFEESELKRVFGNRITETPAGYWFIEKFLSFQYGELSESCKPHIQVLNLLRSHKIKGYTKGIHTLKDKDKDKDKDKEQDNDNRDFSWFKKQIDEIWSDQLPTEKKRILDVAIQNAWNHLSADPIEVSRIDSAGCKRRVMSAFDFVKQERGQVANRGKLQ